MTKFETIIRADKYLKAKPRVKVQSVFVGNGPERRIVKRYLPLLNGDVVMIEGIDNWCETKADAVALAMKFRDMCREKFGEVAQ